MDLAARRVVAVSGQIPLPGHTITMRVTRRVPCDGRLVTLGRGTVALVVAHRRPWVGAVGLRCILSGGEAFCLDPEGDHCVWKWNEIVEWDAGKTRSGV